MRRAVWTLALATLLVLAAACSGGPSAPFGSVDGGASDEPDGGADNPDVPDRPDPPPEFDNGCSVLFHQTAFPSYHVTISDAEWAALEDEFLNRAEREAAGLDPNPYHPVGFEYEGEEVANVSMRLKGQSSWWQTIAFDENPKMQFVIAFNEIDKDGRFKGVRKIELDMPRTDASFLRQRMGLHILRRIGVPAQCANSARLFINGEYYGLYTNLERLDKEFLERVFTGSGEDRGDLWKQGRNIRTNEDTFSWERLSRFWDMGGGLAELEQLADLDASLAVWAAEAMLPHGDGVYIGRANFFLYDHPDRGFLWLPHDLDSVLDFLPADSSPLYPWCAGRFANDREHWNLVLADAGWVATFEEHLAAAVDAYEVDELRALLAEWSEEIAGAVDEDPRKPFGLMEFYDAVDRMDSYLGSRAASVKEWLECRADGGVDVDGDGYDFCHDCDDADAAVYPGAIEVCNGIDDNCDGLIDGADMVTQCG
jgi:hypothetical protein